MGKWRQEQPMVNHLKTSSLDGRQAPAHSPIKKIAKFLKSNTEFDRIDFDKNDLIVYFNNSEDPWSMKELTEGSESRNKLEKLFKELENEIHE